MDMYTFQSVYGDDFQDFSKAVKLSDDSMTKFQLKFKLDLQAAERLAAADAKRSADPSLVESSAEPTLRR